MSTNLKAGSGELMIRWTAAGDGVGEDMGPEEAPSGFLGVSGRCGCIVKEFSMAPFTILSHFSLTFRSPLGTSEFLPAPAPLLRH